MVLYSYHDKNIVASYIRDEKPSQFDFKLHTHPSAEILYVISGKGVFHVEGTHYELSKGNIFITRPIEAHYLEINSSVPYERIVINFSQELFQSFDPDSCLLQPFFNRKAGRFNRYKMSNFDDDIYQKLILSIVRHCDNEKLNIISNLMPLLNLISIAFKGLSPENSGESSIEYVHQ